MSHYPTEGGFKDEKEEPLEVEDFDCSYRYQFDGVCPCCGGWVRTIGGNYDNDPQWDQCDTCDWKGDIEY